MKRAFTLIEMLIVVALIAVLMTIVLRLSGVSSEETARNTTVLRLAQLENCLSGYYAAYGNYPPVRLHNSRDIYQKADGHGVQNQDETDENIWGWSKLNEKEEQAAWSQVKAACQAQPFGAEFPFANKADIQKDIEDLMETLQKNTASGEFSNYPKSGSAEYKAVMAGFDGLQSNLGRFQNAKSAYSWREIQVFKFGVMSYLLPRYQMMMAGDKDIYIYFAQWTKNNGAVSDPLTGKTYTWSELNKIIDRIENNQASQTDRASIENIPSDAVCTRWLPNLANICTGTKDEITYYGVNIIDPASESGSFFSPSEEKSSSFPEIHIYSPGGETTRDQYILDSITVKDGWGSEYYYYSPSPHQSYQLWSAGKNGRTFPPWISRAKLSAAANKCVFIWTEDDVKGMNN